MATDLERKARRYVKLKRLMKDLERKLEPCRDAIEKRLLRANGHAAEIAGIPFQLTKVESERFDRKGAVEHFGEELDPFFKKSVSNRITYG